MDFQTNPNEDEPISNDKRDNTSLVAREEIQKH